MRVSMRVQITGTRDGVDWPRPGGEVDLPDGEARSMVSAGLAAEVAVPAKPETARAAKPRRSAVPKPETR